MRGGAASGWAMRTVEAGVCIAAVGVPLAWTDLVVGEYTLSKFLVLAMGCLTASVGLPFVARARRLSPLDWAVLAALAATGVSAAFSQDRLISLVGRYNSYAYGLWATALYAALYWAARILDGPARRRTLAAALAGGVLVAGYGALQGLGIEPFTLSAEMPLGRAVSTSGSPVDLGCCLAVLAPLALYAARARRAPAHWAILAVICGGLLATASRGAMLSAAGGIAVYLVLSGFRRRPRLSRFRTAAALLFGAGLVVLSLHKLAVRTPGPGDRARVAGWAVAWDVFRDAPLMGTGPDTFEQAFRRRRSADFIRAIGAAHQHAYPHNDVLQVLATSGIAGFGAYCFLLVAAWLAVREAVRMTSTRSFAAALAGGLAAIFIALKFNPTALESFVLAAIWLGLLRGIGPAAGREAPSRPGRAVLCCLAIASAGGAGRLAAADYWVQKGRIAAGAGDAELANARYRRGLELNPCELKYRILLVNGLAGRIRGEPRSPARSGRAAEAARAGRDAVRCHPNDMDSHYIYGFASLLQAQTGRLDRLAVAERELDEALRLDGTFPPLLRLRGETARFAGDRAKAAEMARRLRAIEVLEREP